MKSRPVMGAIGEFRFTVEPEHTIDFAGDGMPAVLSTPTLVRFLERVVPDQAGRDLPAEAHQRNGVHIGIGQGGDHVGHSGS